MTNETSVRALILLNVISSVSIVTVNKYLVEHFYFKFVLLLTSLHFFTGWLFLRAASSEGWKLFTRAEAPWKPIVQLAVAGAGSIALLNYSLRFNSVGTYQIMKVAILPVTMALSFIQGIAKPAPAEIAAAALVVAGTLVCTASDVSVTMFGIILGVAGVVSTAQYQIWQGSVQKDFGLNSTQVLYLMSPPQAAFALLASIMLESNWQKVYGSANGLVAEPGSLFNPREPALAGPPGPEDDIWHHPYSATELMGLLLTCVLAVGLNYSTIAVIGKTSAVTMQFITQLKTVLTIGMSFVVFPRPISFGALGMLLSGLSLVFVGVAWYTRVKMAGAVTPTAPNK